MNDAPVEVWLIPKYFFNFLYLLDVCGDNKNNVNY